MPPKAKITRDMIIEAGLQIVRTEGAENLNVRRVAAMLDCSTQPVMYYFKTVSELKASVYDAANEVHTAYIMAPDSEIMDSPSCSWQMTTGMGSPWISYFIPKTSS